MTQGKPEGRRGFRWDFSFLVCGEGKRMEDKPTGWKNDEALRYFWTRPINDIGYDFMV